MYNQLLVGSDDLRASKYKIAVHSDSDERHRASYNLLGKKIIDQLQKKLNEEVDNSGLHALTSSYELDKWCKEKINKNKMHNLISLACEIKFIKIFNRTIELLRKGDSSSWKKIRITYNF